MRRIKVTDEQLRHLNEIAERAAGPINAPTVEDLVECLTNIAVNRLGMMRLLQQEVAKLRAQQ